jgi:glucose-1-phosphate cytidylyltransferase
LTGTRVRRASRLIDPTGPVFVTYGDGVGNIDLDALLRVHREHGRLATITAVRPPGRFGELVIEGHEVKAFVEKPQTSTGSISGGFLVLEREAIDRYISPDVDVMLEREPLSSLAADGQLTAYEHDGFWQPMDTVRERDLLETMWSSGSARCGSPSPIRTRGRRCVAAPNESSSKPLVRWPRAVMTSPS